MTLTHVIPSLRLTLPDPLNRDLWPESTAALIDDVTVAGISLLHVADVCGTPCRHSGAAVVPRSGGRAAVARVTSVVITMVTGVIDNGTGLRELSVDADVDALCAAEQQAVWTELRLIGRATRARTVSMVIRGRRPVGKIVTVQLAEDVHTGDLLAVPLRAVAVNEEHLGEPDPGQTPAWLAYLE